MSLVNRLTTRSRHGANDDGTHRSLGMIPFWCLGGSLVSAALLVPTALSAPINMMGLHPTELAMQAEQQEESDHWWQIDVDPKFAVDGRPFLIEPAAGPLYEVETQICRHALAEELTCHGEH